MFGISPHQLPRVPSYDMAVRVYNDAPVIRGLEGRPIRTRRDHVKLAFMDADGAVRFRYHQTDLVTWHSDYEVTVIMHDSRSSRGFIGRFLPPGIKVSWFAETTHLSDANGDYIPKRNYITVRRTEEGWRVDPKTCEGYESHRLNLKAAARVRRILRPFNGWSKALDKFNAPHSDVVTSFSDVYSHMRHYFAEGEIPQAFYPYLRWYFSHQGRFQRSSHTRGMTPMYILGGAVEKYDVPPGVARKRDSYRHCTAWHHV